MINALKRWWIRTKIRELKEAYAFNNTMYGYYKDLDYAFNRTLRALNIKLISLSKLKTAK